MKLEIKSRSFELTDAIKEMTIRRAHFALGRFESRIQRTVIRLKDDNGPKKGVDKICQVHVKLCASTDLIIEEKADELYAAIDRAFDRIGRVVAREVQKKNRTKNLSDYGGNWLNHTTNL